MSPRFLEITLSASLPGHVSGLQGSVSEFSPEQGVPLPKAEGLEQVLEPVLVPPPHVTEQVP